MVAAHQADHMQADKSAALQREAALLEEKGRLKLALTTALEQTASTSGALAEAQGRLQEVTQQVRGKSRPADGKPSPGGHFFFCLATMFGSAPCLAALAEVVVFDSS